MALATLCSEYSARHERSRTLTGFIVDHKLRQGSGEEARKVADELDKLDIKPEILTLDWTGYSDPSALPNLESAARRLRYQALGRACRAVGIQSLLVGHHADDQTETALMRMLSGYTGSGLGGMKGNVPLPECGGVYGVGHSGLPRERNDMTMLVEGGGICLHRPLLQVHKDELIAVCRECGVQWFEDHTNRDVTLTMRNTVRSLLAEEYKLPRAFQRQSLLDLAESRQRRKADMEEEAKEIHASMPYDLNIRTGHATFVINNSLREQLNQNLETARHLLRRLLAPVSPKPEISLQDLDQALDLVLAKAPSKRDNSNRGTPPRQVQVAGVQMQMQKIPHAQQQKTGERNFALSRQLPPVAEQNASSMQLWPRASMPSSNPAEESEDDAWQLWDGRYWTRVLPPLAGTTPDIDVAVRFLNESGLQKVRDGMAEDRDSTAKAMQKLQLVPRQDVRRTLPAVFATIESVTDTMSAGKEHLVALPSLGWYAPGWTGKSSSDGVKGREDWRCEIRYKHVELRGDQMHDQLEKKVRYR